MCSSDNNIGGISMLKDLLGAHKDSFKEHTELRAQVNTTRQVAFLAGNMTANSQSTRGGVSARVYKGGTYGFASGAEYSRESIKNVLTAARDNAVFMDKNVNKNMPPLPNLQAGKFETQNKPGKDIPQSVLIDYVKALDSKIAGSYKNLVSRTIVANCLDMEKLLVVSNGCDNHFYQPRSLVYVWLTAETDDGVPVELFHAFGGLGHFDSLFPDPALMSADLDALY